MDVVYNNAGGFFFLYGYGGTGKKIVWNTLSTIIRSKGDIVLNVASSGIASLLLPNRRTAHSRFKIPLNINEDSLCNIKQGSAYAKLLNRAKLIIWDEAPMLCKYCFEALDKCLKDILRFSSSFNPELPFGGKVVVFGGDFRQILPVIPKGSRQDIVYTTINSSHLWSFCKVLRLTRNMRLTVGSSNSDVNETRQFSEWLLKVGEGLARGSTDEETEIEIPEDILINNIETALDDLIDFAYPDILQNMTNMNYFKERTILAPTLEIIAQVNNHRMSRIPGVEKIYLSSDSISKEEGNLESELDTFLPEILNGMNCFELPPHQLTLKVGVPVMLLRNIDKSNGLCNGTKMQVRRLGEHVIECLILTENKVDEIVLIPKMTIVPSNEMLPVKFQRR